MIAFVHRFRIPFGLGLAASLCALLAGAPLAVVFGYWTMALVALAFVVFFVMAIEDWDP